MDWKGGKMEIEDLNQIYKKSQLFEDKTAKIKILEEFKALTDSSELPQEIKDRFIRVADNDIKALEWNLFQK